MAFGDLSAGLWGAAWGGADPFAAIGSLSPGALTPSAAAAIEGSDPAEDWTFSAPGAELSLSPVSEPARLAGADGFDQLCRITGQVVLDSSEHVVSCLGRRGSRAEPDLRDLESIRDISAWFDPAEGLVLTALRPRGGAGHDRDIVSASIFESSGVIPVADPRLSTTYAADGQPVRMSLELWLTENEEGEQYPIRAAGEALGARAASTRGGFDVQAFALRCHSRGHEGIGVYMLVRPR
jgi:hypothetical protein